MNEQFKEILEETSELAERFIFLGYEVYLVGGSIRDLMRGVDLTEKTDLDICTSAHPKDTKALLKGMVQNLWAVGERFGTIGCVYNNRTYEITTFRKEAYPAGSRKPQVKFGDDVLEDLMRRDFTINAMALRLPDGELIDPHNGAEDLANKYLRTPMDPKILFNEDPLRMQRAARFEAQLELTPAPEVLSAMEELADRLDIVSKERQIDEFRRLVCLPDPTTGLERLSETGLLKKVLPDLEIADFSKVKELDAEFQLRLAGLLLSSQEILQPNFPLLSQLKLSKADVRAVRHLIELANLVLQIPDSTQDVTFETTLESARYISIEAKTEQCWKQVLDLARLFNPDVVDQLTKQFEKLCEEVGDPFVVELPLSSAEIMKIFDMRSGPALGEAIGFLKKLYLKKGKLTKQQAVAELKEIFKKRK